MSLEKDWSIYSKHPQNPGETITDWCKRLSKLSKGEFTSDALRNKLYKKGKPIETISPKNTGKADTDFIFRQNKNFLSFEDGEYDIRTPYVLTDKNKKILVISDIHIPYHVRPSVMLALENGKDCDTIILNGDIIDFYACSFWDKRPDKTLLKREIEMGWNFFDGLRKMFPDADIIFKSGNHEFRFERYLVTKAPAFFGIEQFAIPELLKLKEYGIRYVNDKQIIKCGDLNIIHGHEIRMTMGAINVARTIYLKANASVMFSDRHITQEYIQRDINGDIHGAWAVACLCDLSPDYSPVNNWNHGFAKIERYADGNFTVENKKIINGKVL